ncbi:response regulator transcription factor [Okeanomitos corallinicola TIOX110]|uniref:Response regulator transcription factor n=1 Tax=Okeanomitos corallinicola TIOX110 TaxID=3133117 RepID=A0ABZ2UR69_9CYAN
MSKIRVVLIEDHDLTRLGIRTALLQTQEIEIVGESANATQGLKILKNLRPDIAIVDIVLPGKDGIELTKEVKRITATENLKTKVLILTLEDSRDSVLAAFAAGADSYCMKDINFNNLLEAIRVTHHGYAWIDPAIARIILQQVQQNRHLADGKSSNRQSISNNLESDLTTRELEVLQLIADGCSNLIISQRLFITTGTVKTHVRNILNKLGADDRTQAAVIALRNGIVR